MLYVVYGQLLTTVSCFCSVSISNDEKWTQEEVCDGVEIYLWFCLESCGKINREIEVKCILESCLNGHVCDTCGYISECYNFFIWIEKERERERLKCNAFAPVNLHFAGYSTLCES